VMEEFTLNALIDFHFKFKNDLPSFDKATVVKLLGLELALDREIRFFHQVCVNVSS